MTGEQLEQRVAELERTVAALRQQVAQLTEEADEAQAPLIELTPELKAEIERRLADAEANPGDSYSWEEVEASIREKLGRLKQ